MDRFVPGEGPVPSLGMIVGEAPGAEEARQGRPFVGASGDKLNEALEAAEWTRKWTYITNCYKFRPPNNRPPTEEELKEHELYILDEFRTVAPLYVLLLGGTAAKQWISPDLRISKHRGEWTLRYVEGEPRYFFPTFHPSYVLRGKGGAEFFADVRTFVEALRGKNRPH